MEKKFTVFIDGRNRTNYQVLAKNELEAREKAVEIYRKRSELPSVIIEEGWIEEKDGEDK